MLNKNDFLLNNKIYYFNNGSYGACPWIIFNHYQNIQKTIEYQPVDFFQHQLILELDKSRTSLSSFVNCNKNDIILIKNATYAINCIIRSLDLDENDEIITTNHEYGACLNSLQFWQEQRKFKIKMLHYDLPLPADKDILLDIEKSITSETKVIFFSHITSLTSQIFPAKKICQLAEKHNILSIVDGAHSIGHIPLDLQDIGADYYFSNLHKWFFAPKGTAFLYTKPTEQKKIKPLITSWGWGQHQEMRSGNQYIDSNQFYGTDDLSSFICVPKCIKFFQENNIDEVSTRCNKLVKYFLSSVKEITGFPSLYNVHSNYLKMGVVELPNTYNIDDLKKILYDKFSIEVPVVQWNEKQLIRISVWVYNTKSQIDYFLEVLKKLYFSNIIK